MFKITVTGPGGETHAIDLEQEGEQLWRDFVAEMQNAGHGADTICRTIIERLKGVVAPIVTAAPGVNSVLDAVNAATDRVRAEFVSDVQGIRDDFKRRLAAIDDGIGKTLDFVSQKHAPSPAAPANDATPKAADAVAAGA